MNSVLEKYFSLKRNEIMTYVDKITAMFSYTIETPIDNKSQTIKKILNKYYDKYYMVPEINYDLVSKYYNFNEATDSNYKTIIQCIIEYFESENKNIIELNDIILYFSYVIYFAFLIEKLKDTIIMLPNKADFIISIAGKVTSNFKYKKNERFKNHVNKLNGIIKHNIKLDSKAQSIISKSNNQDSYNEYVCICDELDLYKIKYNYRINDLKLYSEQDIEKVYINENLNSTFRLMSYELSLITLFKSLINDQKINIVLEVDENFYKRKSNIASLEKLASNAYTAEHTYLLIKGNEYSKNENLNTIKSLGIKILIDTDKYEEVKNIVFDKNMILLTTGEFILKYRQDLELRKIKYIKKTTERTFREDELFYTKVDFVEVYNE